MLDTVSDLINDLMAKIIDLIPSLVLALLIFILGLTLAWLIKRLIRRLINYLDLIINERLKTKLLSVDLRSISSLISKTFYWAIVIITIAIVTHIIGLPVLTIWIDGFINYLPNILAAVLIVFAGIIVGKLAGDLISSGTSRSGIPNAVKLGNFVRYILLTISILIAVDQIGIDILFIIIIICIVLAALLFGAALAFGLGARTSVNNILSSYYLQKTYKEGDTIRIDDIEGIIIKITPTTVVIESTSGQISIPAKDFSEKMTVLIRKN